MTALSSPAGSEPRRVEEHEDPSGHCTASLTPLRTRPCAASRPARTAEYRTLVLNFARSGVGCLHRERSVVTRLDQFKLIAEASGLVLRPAVETLADRACAGPSSGSEGGRACGRKRWPYRSRRGRLVRPLRSRATSSVRLR